MRPVAIATETYRMLQLYRRHSVLLIAVLTGYLFYVAERSVSIVGPRGPDVLIGISIILIQFFHLFV